MITLLMIADDFTGALDTGVQFAACGVKTRVITGPRMDLRSVPAGVEVLAVDAETRHLSAQEAYQVVAEIVEQAQDMGIPYIYKKTDSALRGNVGAELAALLERSGQRQLPFFPAFPQMGRTTVGGIQRIDGVPVAESVFGSDPFEPVRHSEVAQVIWEQSDLPVWSCPSLTQGGDTPPQEGILVFDAKSVQELQVTGQRLWEEGRLRVMAGCAGFGALLPDLLNCRGRALQQMPQLDPKLLVVCGSVNPITVEQILYAEKANFVRIQLSPEQKLDTGHWETAQGMEELSFMQKLVERQPYCIIDTNDISDRKRIERYARERGIDRNGIRDGVSRSIGYIVSHLFADPAVGTLLVTGGDTLFQCMKHMGVHEIEPLCEMDTGVVLSRFTYQGCTRYILSKSGGFGQPSLLVELAHQLQRNVRMY